jgi:hypothetical protein
MGCCAHQGLHEGCRFNRAWWCRSALGESGATKKTKFRFDVSDGTAAIVRGQGWVGAAASYCQRPRNRPSPQPISGPVSSVTTQPARQNSGLSWVTTQQQERSVVNDWLLEFHLGAGQQTVVDCSVAKIAVIGLLNRLAPVLTLTLDGT